MALSGMDRLSIASFVVTVAGFGFALYQLRRTQKAAVSAQRAGEEVREQLQNVQLAWLLPRFQEVEAELEATRDLATAQRALSQWRGFAPQAEAILGRNPHAPSGLAKELRTTAALASSAQQSLREGVEIMAALRVVLPNIRNCNYNMAVYVASISLAFGPGQPE